MTKRLCRWARGSTQTTVPAHAVEQTVVVEVAADTAFEWGRGGTRPGTYVTVPGERWSPPARLAFS